MITTHYTSNDKTSCDMQHFIKHNVSVKEYEMHKHISELGIVYAPKIIDYNRETNILVMEKINYMCVSDSYGENEEDISDDLFGKIKKIIKLLWDNNIVYPDITGYNFIEYDNKIWIIDFEHSDFKHSDFKSDINDKYVEKFVSDNNYKFWNPRFK